MTLGSPRRQPASYLAVALQLVGAGVTLIAAFVPWVRSHALFLTIPVNGVQTDYGRIFPFLALAVFALLAYQWSYGWQRWAPAVALLLGLTAIVIAVLYGIQVKNRVGLMNESARRQPEAPLVLSGGSVFGIDFDVGYYLTLLGGAGVVVGTVLDLKATRPQTS